MYGISRMTALTGHRLRIFENRALRRVRSCVFCQYVEGLRTVNNCVEKLCVVSVLQNCVLCQYVTGAEENKNLCVVSVCNGG